ncbi:hypothetical protein KUTeg_004737 [Tegillarca granosa]|uniref:Uncharacterized protein n=1 Tax=Tegillarca granosa TaxID=220873 RepID=A0ABQ9FHP9_TEGGR|nr:hypothetical protein KUTeg_004737 [Tegillarca granosa]
MNKCDNSSRNKSTTANGECGGGHFITREGWNAMAPKNTEHMKTPVSIVFIHHTGMGCCDTREDCVKHVKEVQKVHVFDKRFQAFLM